MEPISIEKTKLRIRSLTTRRFCSVCNGKLREPKNNEISVNNFNERCNKILHSTLNRKITVNRAIEWSKGVQIMKSKTGTLNY